LGDFIFQLLDVQRGRDQISVENEEELRAVVAHRAMRRSGVSGFPSA